jgi:hypothetical protein
MNQTVLHNTIRSEEQTPITVTDSSSIDFTVSGVNNHTITADIKRDTVSNGGNNILINTVNGVYVPPASATETPLVANDSSSINFTTSGTNSHTVTGVVKISAADFNVITINSDGLYVPVVAGPEGPMGATGPMGPEGPTGLPGADGLDGEDGTDGTDGTDGVEGPQGPQGIQGPQGVQGPIGATGPQGPAGPTHVPVTVTDSTSIDFTASGTDNQTITGVVKRDTVTGSGNNILQIGANGVYVPPPSASIGTDISIDFTPEISTGPLATFDTSVYFSPCSGTPTYVFQWIDSNVFYDTTINASTGVLTYQFTPYYYGGISNNCVVIQRTCNGVVDIVRFNYVIDFSLIQALNTYYEEAIPSLSPYALTINSVTPQYLQFFSSSGNANMFTLLPGNILLRYDGIAGIPFVGTTFEVHLSGNVSVPDDEDFTIRLLQNGAPVTNKVLKNRWRDNHSFAKHYVIIMNSTDTIGFDVLHSNLISPGNISTTFSDVCVLLKPIGYAL